MFAPTEYINWIVRHLGRASFDLAQSGMNGADRPTLDVPASLESFAAWDALRARIATYNGVAADEALPVLGTTHALWTAYVSLLSPGDEVLVERVTYEPMYRIAEGIGAKVNWFERPASARFALDPALIAHAMTERTRVVAITNMHNPSGNRADESAIREVAAIASKQGAYLLVDEVYAPFDSLCDDRGVWSESTRNLAPNIVAVGSLTKCYGLGPHRIGWVLGPREIVAHGYDALVASIGYPPLPWMAFAVRAFERLPELAQWSRARLAGKQARVEAWLATRPHLAWSAPTGGLFGFVTDTRTMQDLTERIEQGVREHDVIVAPGAFFGAPNGFRLAWSIDAARLDEALMRLSRVVD